MKLLHRHRDALLFAGAVLLYLFLAVYRLARQDGQPDEMHTLYAAQLHPLHLLYERGQAGHPPLYFLLIHYLLKLGLPVKLPALIAPSIVFGAGALVVLHRLARELKLGSWSVLTAYLWAVHPSILYQTRYARPTTGTLLLVLFILLLVCRLHGPAGKRMTLLLLSGVAVIGAFWAHLILGIWAVLGLLLTFPGFRRKFDLRLIAITAAAMLLHIGVIAGCRLMGPTAVNWLTRPAGADILQILLRTWAGEDFYWRNAGWQSALAAAMMVTWIAVTWQLLSRRVSDARWTLIYCCVVLPVAALIAVSLVKPVLHARYLTVYLPPLLLCAAYLAREIKWRKLLLGVAVVMLIGLANHDRYHYRVHESGIRRGLHKIEEISPDRRNLVVSYLHTLPQMVQLFMSKPTETLVLDAYDKTRNEPARAKLQQHLQSGGAVWELAPAFYPDTFYKEMGGVTGESGYQKHFPLFAIRMYEAK